MNVWMKLGDEAPIEVPFDPFEIARRRRMGFRQCPPPTAGKEVYANATPEQQPTEQPQA